MGNCKRCDKTYEPEDNFCGFCGFNLSAQETSEMATQLSLKASDIHFNLGLKYYNESKYKQALEAFERTIEQDPSDVRGREMYDRTREALMKAA